MPFDHGGLCTNTPGCHCNVIGLDHVQDSSILATIGSQQIKLGLLALTVLDSDVLQTLAESLTLLGVIRSNRTPEATHQTVLDVLLPSLIDDLQRRCDHLLLIHVIAEIGPFPLELIDALLRSLSRQRYRLHLLLAEPIVKRSVLVSLSLTLSLFGSSNLHFLSKFGLVDEEALQFAHTTRHILDALLQQAFLDGHNLIFNILVAVTNWFHA